MKVNLKGIKENEQKVEKPKEIAKVCSITAQKSECGMPLPHKDPSTACHYHARIQAQHASTTQGFKHGTSSNELSNHIKPQKEDRGTKFTFNIGFEAKSPKVNLSNEEHFLCYRKLPHQRQHSL